MGGALNQRRRTSEVGTDDPWEDEGSSGREEAESGSHPATTDCLDPAPRWGHPHLAENACQDCRGDEPRGLAVGTLNLVQGERGADAGGCRRVCVAAAPAQEGQGLQPPS